MGAETKIEWTRRRRADGSLMPGHTFNPWIGCTKVTAACDHCYAETLMDHRHKRVVWGPHGERVRTAESTRNAPFKWNRAAAALGERHFVFCASLADVFDNQVPFEWRDELFDVIRRTQNLVYLLLTKRPQNIVKMVNAIGPLPENVALGTSTGDQKDADRNVPALLDAKRRLNPLFAFVSAEPLLGPIDFETIWLRRDGEHTTEMSRMMGDYIRPLSGCFTDSPTLDWIIVGGESGPKARPMHPQWARDIRDQCAAAGVPFFMKQWGEWLPDRQSCEAGPYANASVGHRFDDGTVAVRAGKARAGRRLDGVEHNAMPDLTRAAA